MHNLDSAHFHVPRYCARRLGFVGIFALSLSCSPKPAEKAPIENSITVDANGYNDGDQTFANGKLYLNSYNGTYESLALGAVANGENSKDFGLPRDVAYYLEDPDMDGLTGVACADPNPNDADTDDDGLMDGLEVLECLATDGFGSYGTDPNNWDSDGDGLSDGLEIGLDGPYKGILFGPTRREAIGTSGELTMMRSDTMSYHIPEFVYLSPPRFSDTNQNRQVDGVRTYQIDLDPNTTTDPLEPDANLNGLLDGEEDSNRNGRVDPDESDPNAGIRRSSLFDPNTGEDPYNAIGLEARGSQWTATFVGQVGEIGAIPYVASGSNIPPKVIVRHPKRMREGQSQLDEVHLIAIESITLVRDQLWAVSFRWLSESLGDEESEIWFESPEVLMKSTDGEIIKGRTPSLRMANSQTSPEYLRILERTSPPTESQ